MVAYLLYKCKLLRMLIFRLVGYPRL